MPPNEVAVHVGYLRGLAKLKLHLHYMWMQTVQGRRLSRGLTSAVEYGRVPLSVHPHYWESQTVLAHAQGSRMCMVMFRDKYRQQINNLYT